MLRRRRRQAYASEEAEINMTPMLDIVFIMLIFFIVTASFVNETGLNINRPQASTAAKSDTTPVMVGLSAGGEIRINRQVVDIQTIPSVIGQLRAEQPESPVLIQADQDSSTGLLVRVMDKIRLGGLSRISIAADMAKK